MRRGVGRIALCAALAAPAVAQPATGPELVAAAVEAMGGATAVAALETLEVTAECTGPGGAYHSAVHWRRDGHTLLRQGDDSGRQMLLAEGDKGWKIDGKGEKGAELSAEMVAMVHGHAFHPTLFEIDRRFHAHRAAGTGEDGCLLVEMLDQADRPASLCLDPATKLPARFSFTPAGPGGEIRMQLSDWRRIGRLVYFKAFDLRQGEELYRWVYSTREPTTTAARRPTGGDRPLPAAWKPGERISLSLKDAALADVLRSFARMAGFNLVLDPSVKGAVTVELQDVPWEQALEVILKTHGLAAEVDGAAWRVRPR